MQEQKYLKEQLEQFKLISNDFNSKKSAVDAEKEALNLDIQSSDTVDNTRRIHELSDEHRRMIQPQLSYEQKNTLITMMLNIQEVQTKIKRLQVELNENSISEYKTTFRRVVTLKAGDSFGELALIDSRKGQRAATITCLENCTMAVINAEDYQRMLAKIEKKKRNNLVEFICSMPYFKAMHRIQINKLINSFSSITFQRG